MSVEQLNIAKNLDLPSPPRVIQQLQSRLSEKDINNYEIARIIEADPAFTARVLRLVNSPFYGFAGKIVSVEEAITMLGFNAVHQLLLATSLLNALKLQHDLPNTFGFWQHSLGVGILARNLLPRSNKDIRNEAFTSGVLHDIGRLLLARIDIEKFISFYSGPKTATNLEAEEYHFGVDHQRLGLMLTEKWNLPHTVCMCVGNHHTPEVLTESGLTVSAINIADMLCHALNIGDSYNFYVTSFHPQAWAKLNLTMAELEKILISALKEVDDSRHVIGEFA
jgi:HD-like signal output (HDOD) protein